MTDATTQTEGQGPFQLHIDPVYGPNSKYFWPGSWLYASSYVLTPVRISPYVSGRQFLEIYAESFSGVKAYIESTEYLDESYCDELYDHFYNLYKDVESWDRSTLFVSAVYRDLFHKMFPYQSELLELRTDLFYKSIYEPYLKEGRYDEAIRATGKRSFKEADKRKRGLSSATCSRLMSVILSSYTDLSLISELIMVLHRTNIAVNYQKQLKEGFLSQLEKDTNALSLLGDETKKDLYGKKLVLSLSLLQIESEAAQKAVDESLSLLSYEPIISLIRDHPFAGQGWPSNSLKNGFVSDEASAYYIAPRYTATDYIRDLVLSDQAYTRLFQKVQDSAESWSPTSVLMSFEEQGEKIAQLAFSEMIRELLQENTDLSSLVAPVANSLDEDDLIASEQVPLEKIFNKIGEKIDVPFKARRRIVEICREKGMPDTEVLAEKIISQVSPTNRFSRGEGGSALEKLVGAFSSLLVLALAILFTRNSHRQFSINAQSYNETGYLRLRGGGFGPTSDLEETSKQVATPKNVRIGAGRMASLSSVHSNRLINSLSRQERSKTQRQTKRASQESIVAKKDFENQNPTFLTTKGDKEKFDDIYIRGHFNGTKKEVSIEGSCGPAHRLEQLRAGPVTTIAKNRGWAVRKVELDHHLSSRVRQGLGHHYERPYDISIVEAISPRMHKVITAKGKETYDLPEGIVSVDNYLNQILTNRIDVFKSGAAQAIMDKEGVFTDQDYIACSERSSTWNRKFFRYIAEQDGVGTDCVKSLLYPRQLFDDANGYLYEMRNHLRRTAPSDPRLTAPSDLEETQALLTETIEQVSLRVSLLANFRDSSPGLPGLVEDMERLVFQCNQLNDVANSRYRLSRFTSRRLEVPPLGRIISLDKTISGTDDAGYIDQWELYGAKPEASHSLLESPKLQYSLKKYNKLVLTTTGLVDEPMSESMKELMNVQLAGQMNAGFL